MKRKPIISTQDFADELRRLARKMRREADRAIDPPACAAYAHAQRMLEGAATRIEQAGPTGNPECKKHWIHGPWMGPLKKCEDCGQMVPGELSFYPP